VLAAILVTACTTVVLLLVEPTASKTGASVATFIDVDTTPPEQHSGALTVAEGSRVAGDPARWPLACSPS
jgi:hypothetical protein